MSKDWEWPWETHVHRVSLVQQAYSVQKKRSTIYRVIRNSLMSEVYLNLCYQQRGRLQERWQKITLMIHRQWIRVRDLPSVNTHYQSITYHKKKSIQKFKRSWESHFLNWIHLNMVNPHVFQSREVKMIIQKHYWRKYKQLKINQISLSIFKIHLIIINTTIFWILD